MLAGCIYGTTARQSFQAEGALVVLTAGGQFVAGELLEVGTDTWTLDALGPTGAPARVVRIPATAIVEGTVYTGAPMGRWSLDGADPPKGVGILTRIGSGGAVDGRLDVRLVSRFPYGMPPAALDALLALRGQTQPDPLP